MAELIRLENIRKSYGENEVLKNITISIQEKEFVTLLGPSGCGKTTTLRILGASKTRTAAGFFLTERISPTCRPTGET